MENLQKQNVMLATYMGDRNSVLNDPKWQPTDAEKYLKYHFDWNWIMPVVIKIKSEIIQAETLNVSDKEIRDWDDFSYAHLYQPIFFALQLVDITRLHAAVVEFVEWRMNVKK